MSQQVLNLTVEIIFLLVALMHALRLYNKWEVAVDGKRIPTWASGVGLVIAGYLSYAAHVLSM